MANRATLVPEPPSPEESLSFVQERMSVAEADYARARSDLLSARAAVREKREALLRRGGRLGKLRRAERFAMEALGLDITMLDENCSEEFVQEYGDEIQDDDPFTEEEGMVDNEDDDDDGEAGDDPTTQTMPSHKRTLGADLQQPSSLSSSSSSSGQARPSISARMTSASRSSHNPYIG